MAIPLKVDITTGDRITPKEIECKFKLLTEDRTISILAYNLETNLAENLEAIISRVGLNTRPRDYYDVYILSKLQHNNVEFETLKIAFYTICEKRNVSNLITRSEEILQMVIDNKSMSDRWEIYQRDFDYAKEINFMDTRESVSKLLDNIK